MKQNLIVQYSQNKTKKNIVFSKSNIHRRFRIPYLKQKKFLVMVSVIG